MIGSVVSKLLRIEPVAPPATSPPPGWRACWRCEVAWTGGPECWMCGRDVRYQRAGGGL